MHSLTKKIDFALVFQVRNANPNGDPLNGNRPRQTFDNHGEVTDVCIKRKFRDRLLERCMDLQSQGKETSGQGIFVQADDRRMDDYPSLKARVDAVLGTKLKADEMARKACETWFDVRAFGQLFAFKGSRSDGVSIGIRGPVSIHSAFSVSPIDISSTQITKSVNGEGDGSKQGSDTMGMRFRVDHAVYVGFGSMSPQLAQRTGFSDADALVIKELLPRLFENDASAARPDGSMRVLKALWWEHNCAGGQYSAARVHQSLSVSDEGEITLNELSGLACEVIEGF